MTPNITKLGIPAAVVTSALVLLAPTIAAYAVSPHFISASSGLTSSGDLTCTFKEAGLGNLGFSNIKETCSADASAIWGCVNNGGNHPQAANKETVTGTVSNSGFFPIRNGQTSGTITVSPPSPTSDFSCPNGQHLELLSASYTNVMLCDQLGNCVQLSNQSYTNPKFA